MSEREKSMHPNGVSGGGGAGASDRTSMLKNPKVLRPKSGIGYPARNLGTDAGGDLTRVGDFHNDEAMDPELAALQRDIEDGFRELPILIADYLSAGFDNDARERTPFAGFSDSQRLPV